MKFLKALAVFVGTIIGVGIFGLPYIASKAGFLVVLLYFLFMSAVTIMIHLVYGKVALGTESLCRLPGYAGEYLGANWKKISFLIFALGLSGALLAYLIIGGEFLNSFFLPYLGDNLLAFTLLFFSVGALLIFRGIKQISFIETILLFILFAILIAFSTKTFSSINLDYFKNINLGFLTFPYGVVLFSLWGASLVPEVREMLGDDEKALKRVILSGILLSTITYLFFIFIILGVTGPNTTKEAISGLFNALGGSIIKLGFIFGVITCFTSFITLGLTLKKVFLYDFNLRPDVAWFIACFFPLMLFALGLREFLDIIGLTGAVAIGFEGVIIIFIYREFLKKKLAQKMNPLFYALPAIFVLGVAFQIFYFVVR